MKLSSILSIIYTYRLEDIQIKVTVTENQKTNPVS